jgi:NitT/TauT family transport system substrate-binding protein
MDRINTILISLLCLLLTACSQPKDPTIKLAINPWPGYEFLYLAKEKGLYEKAGLNVEIIEAPSLAEVKRLFHQGKANAMTSTMIEAVTLAAKYQKKISIVLIADYSNGGDMILAKTDIADFNQIVGKRVGVELGSLGSFFLHQALAKNDLTLSDIDMLNIEQLDASEAFDKDLIDAYVTYPPYANILQKDHDVHMIFNSRDIPKTILDVVTVSSDLLEQDPTWINRFHNVWQTALDYAKKHPIEAHNIMAKREGIDADEFAAALTDLKILTSADQKALLTEQGLKQNMQQVCSVLNVTNNIEFDCTQLSSYLKIGTLSD